MKARLPLLVSTPVIGGHSTALLGFSFQAHQSCSCSCALAPISLLSQAQTSFSSDCLLHNWLVWVCVLRRPGPISAVNMSSQRAGEVWTLQNGREKSWSTKEKKNIKTFFSFVIFLFSFSVRFWMVWLLWTLKQFLSWINMTRLQVWRSSVRRLLNVVGSRTWWFYRLGIGFQSRCYGLSDAALADAGSERIDQISEDIDWLIWQGWQKGCQTSFIHEVFGETTFSQNKNKHNLFKFLLQRGKKDEKLYNIYIDR